ncbi:MAG: hypothetical protein HYT22_01220 [Candidatus Niyogibacteria bacterium]|nr:hypothetical protein [Candidatus Niyogibacteria bacterium]
MENGADNLQVVSLDDLEQTIAGIDAKKEEQKAVDQYTMSLLPFFEKLPVLVDKLIAEQYRSGGGGGQDEVIRKQILERGGLDPVAQFRARMIYFERLAFYARQHGGVPSFAAVMRAVKEYRLIKEAGNKAQGARNAYIVGETKYTLSLEVSSELREFAEQKFFPALRALERVSSEKAHMQRETARRDFRADVTITPLQFLGGTSGVTILPIPPRRFKKTDRETKEEIEITQPGGQVKMESNGRTFWVLDATGSKRFIDAMERGRDLDAKVLVRSISEAPPLKVKEWREINEETLRSMTFVHAAVHACWQKMGQMKNARDRATIPEYEFVLGPKKPGVSFFRLPMFYWKTRMKGGTEIPIPYSDLWGLIERDKEGMLQLLEYDSFAFEFLAACMGKVKPGDKYAGVLQPLRSVLQRWNVETRELAEQEKDPEWQRIIAQWKEEAATAAAAATQEDQAHRDHLARLKETDPDGYERAIAAEQAPGDDTGDDDPEGVQLGASESEPPSGESDGAEKPKKERKPRKK